MYTNLNSQNEAIVVFREITEKLKQDAKIGKWLGIIPDYFELDTKYEDEITLSVRYNIEKIGRFNIELEIFLEGHYNPSGIWLCINFWRSPHITGVHIKYLLNALEKFSLNFKEFDEDYHPCLTPDDFWHYTLCSKYESEENNLYEDFVTLLNKFISCIKDFQLNNIEPNKYMGKKMSQSVKEIISFIEECDITTGTDEMNLRIKEGCFGTSLIAK